MSSRFFAAGSDSESSSEEEEYSLESEEDQDEEQEESEEESSEEEDKDEEDESEEESSDEEGVGAARFLKAGGGASGFLKGESSESEEEEERQIIKSARDKRFDELDQTVKLIGNAVKINDWAAVSDAFDKAVRLLPNLAKQLDGRNPKLFVKTLVELDENVASTWEQQKGAGAKKMNAVNQRGLNAVRQKVRKMVREDQYVRDVDKFKEDPDAFMEEEEVQPPAAQTKVKVPKIAADILATEQAAALDDAGFEVVGRRNFTPESIMKHLRVIADSRGKKSYDKLEALRTMERLLEASNTNYLRVRVLLQLVASRLDSSSGSHLTMEAWNNAYKDYSTLVDILLNTPSIAVVEGAEDIDDDTKIAEGQQVTIPGSMVSLATMLEEEYLKILNALDCHGQEFIDALKDSPNVGSAALKGTILIEVTRKRRPEVTISEESLCRLLIRRLEQLYFRPSVLVKQHEELIWKDISPEFDSTVTPRSLASDPDALIHALCSYLFAHSDGIVRARTMLCQCYWLALHDKYYQARDHLLMSHLSETIGSFDVSTQILFNRALVQIGMSAFRLGLIYDAQTTLQEICNGRQKELLAQGVQMQRYSSVSPEQERLEKQRLLPFHMHINLELLEAIFLTSSMLLEIPLLAQLGSSPEARRKVISKTFRRLLEYNERSVFTGPPENTRDHVLQAAKALANGDWKIASELIAKISVWKLLPKPQDTITMLESRIKIEGVRTYLFTYAPYYDTLSLQHLSDMFELSRKEIQAIVSKMIASEELAAALDQVEETVVFRRGVELSRLQVLGLALSDKASGLIEANEKTLEQRTQGTAGAFDRGQGGAGRGGRGGRGGARARGGFGGQSGQNRPRGQGFTGGALGRAIQA
jgi:translation initiation factor 3 subunit C